MQLTDKIDTLKGIGPKKAQSFVKAGIQNLEDLLCFFPRKYEDRREVIPMESLQTGKDALVCGKILSRRYSGNPYKKNTPLTLLVADETGTVEVVFFNGRYIANLFNINQEYTFYGRVTANYDRMQMVHPEFHKKGDPSDVRGIIPVYPIISGISQNEIRKLQKQISVLYENMTEWLPEEIIQENRLASEAFALENIHFPKDAKRMLQGKFRLIFDELLTLETGLFYIKNETRKDTGGIVIDGGKAEPFIENLPFTLTEGQKSVWEDMKKDLVSQKVMNRLIQGDVGSGKTVVADGNVCSSKMRIPKRYDGADGTPC